MKYLSTILFVVLLGIIWYVSYNNISKNDITKLITLNSDQFKKEITDADNAVILDIRTVQELEETWIIDWAINIDFYNADFKMQISSLDKNKEYFLYCRSGNRSNQTIALMTTLWFKNINELNWGITAWINQWNKTIPFNKE